MTAHGQATDGGADGAARPRVRVAIDRLVLRGVAASERDALVAALQGGLQRDLAAGGAEQLGAGRSLASLPSATLRVAPGAGPAALGAAAGRHIARALRTDGPRGGAA